MAISVTNPATGETLETFDELTDADLEAKLAAAAATFRTYRRTTFAERGRWMTRAGDILDERTDDIARMMTTEMGKTFAAAKAEVGKCAKVCRYYAEHAEEYLAERPADAGAVGASRAFTRWEPIGPVLAVMPW